MRDRSAAGLHGGRARHRPPRARCGVGLDEARRRTLAPAARAAALNESVAGARRATGQRRQPRVAASCSPRSTLRHAPARAHACTSASVSRASAAARAAAPPRRAGCCESSSAAAQPHGRIGRRAAGAAPARAAHAPDVVVDLDSLSGRGARHAPRRSSGAARRASLSFHDVHASPSVPAAGWPRRAPPATAARAGRRGGQRGHRRIVGEPSSRRCGRQARCTASSERPCASRERSTHARQRSARASSREQCSLIVRYSRPDPLGTCYELRSLPRSDWSTLSQRPNLGCRAVAAGPRIASSRRPSWRCRG